MFKVSVEDLGRFSAAMEDLSGQADAAGRYADNYLSIDAEQGRIYVSTNELVDEIKTSLTAIYDKLASLCAAASTELTKSAEMYRSTDFEAAERQDASYPGPQK